MAMLYSTPLQSLPPANKLNLKKQNLLVSKIESKNNLNVRLPKSGPYNNNGNKISCNLFSKVDKDALKNELRESATSMVDWLDPATFTPPNHHLKRKDFPPDFIFGASTSALQTEGNGHEGGRGKSTWDDMLQGRSAVDSYHLYKEDVKLLKEMGLNTYRFSIAWPRILPKGTLESGINQEGIDFYNNLIDELLTNGITPMVTLFHFDLPKTLQDQYYGFLRPNIIEQFMEFADVCFEKFGDRVKYWGTINEPYVFGTYGYKMGLPKDVKDGGPFIATHNIILAHAAAVKLYKDKYQKSQGGKIGISLPCKWYVPYSTDPKDFAATELQLDFTLGWYMDPLTRGEYPESMQKNIKGLPKFTKSEKKMVKGAFDYIGINYYTSRYVQHTCTVDPLAGKVTIEYSDKIADDDGKLIGWQAKGQDAIYVRPDGLKNLLLYIKAKYHNPEVYVTENGVPGDPKITGPVNPIEQDNSPEMRAEFSDDYRIEHLHDHLVAVQEARKKGANVKGYIGWTLMDNMEIGAGYDVRFGFNYTDYYDNYKRYPKKSAKWFANFLGVKGPPIKDVNE